MNTNTELEAKLNILKKKLPILSSVPYTRLIILAGSVAVGLPKTESDIDLIIVSEKNRIWLNRFFMEFAAMILGKRRSKKKLKDRFCFNMFLSNASPRLPHQDSVGANFYKNLRPVWGSAEEIENFWNANSWIKKYTGMNDKYREKVFGENQINTNTAKKIMEKTLDASGIGMILEKISFAIQKFYLDRAYKKIIETKDADFFIDADLAAYHFPISNYSRALKEHQKRNRPI